NARLVLVPLDVREEAVELVVPALAVVEQSDRDAHLPDRGPPLCELRGLDPGFVAGAGVTGVIGGRHSWAARSWVGCCRARRACGSRGRPGADPRGGARRPCRRRRRRPRRAPLVPWPSPRA